MRLRTDIEYKGTDTSIRIRSEEWPLLQDHVRLINLFASLVEFIPHRDETIFVRTITGAIIKIDNISIHSHMVLEVKYAVWELNQLLPSDHQMFVFAGRRLEDDEHALDHHNIYPGATLYHILPLRGGWGWSSLGKRRQMVPLLPRAQPLGPSQLTQMGFIYLHYTQRTVLTSWNADFKVSRFVYVYSSPSTG